jgi:glycosyltransferase involved in cell wall biosynthesis
MILLVLVVSIITELLLYNRRVWPYRLIAVIFLTLLITSTTTLALFESLNWLGVLLTVIAVGRLANLFRIAKARIHEAYLRRTAQRTSQVLCLLQLTVIGLIGSVLPLPFNLTGLPLMLALAQCATAVLLLIITANNIFRTKYRQGEVFFADAELPTVSLLIPARNETYDLEEVLRTAIACDYPKLEIIVLDDCSQAKTSEIIKSFAHDGVRFVKGDDPNDSWLAKNAAYQKLSREASGEVLLFCGVDVRFGPHAIKALVTELLVRDKQMISVLPHRLSGSMSGAFVQPMRYWWELALPRRFLNRPPVLSTCWLIQADALHDLGGFKAVSHSIIPEGFFARELVKTDAYSFIRADDTLDIQTRKSYKEQLATTVRTRYPQLRRRPENVLLLSIVQTVFLLGPFIGIMVGLVINDTVLTALSIAASTVLTTNHLLIVQKTSPANILIALVNFPVEVLTEIYLTNLSMLRYEFGSVEWKDRNVCIPVMHVIPRLPKA